MKELLTIIITAVSGIHSFDLNIILKGDYEVYLSTGM